MVIVSQFTIKKIENYFVWYNRII